ncbi:MAG: methionine synthase [Armatimonadetes bacterium]|nr:methionine synthase [Armatimonadota bacterium]
MSDFLTELAKRVLVADGAMGTVLQSHDLSLDDFDGREGCNEILCLTRPDVVRAIHERYFEVGCDCVETNAFGANAVVLNEYELGDRTYDINLAAARLATEAASRVRTSLWPRFVLGNLGPGTRLPSLGHIDFDTLAGYYRDQVIGLIDGGVDALILETCQDILQVKCALAGIDDAARQAGRRPPVIVQVTMETTGTMLCGTELGAALTSVLGYDIQMFGLNCATGPELMEDHVRYLAEHCPLPISVMPNAGLPQLQGGRTVYPLGPEQLASWHERFVMEYGVRLVGGCCGTSPDHLAAVAERIGTRAHALPPADFEPSLSSLYQRVTVAQENSFLMVGERCNTSGSKAFREMLQAGDWDGMVQLARQQVRGGAMVLDLCVDYVGRDGVVDMTEVASRFATQVQVPIMVDSTEAPVLESALKHLGGKSVINSVNLENGLERPAQIFPMAKRYNAAVVALTIDEEGMARTADRKVEIARRIYDIAVDEYGLDPRDLYFDALTLPVSTGIEEDRANARETVEGIRRIKEACPGSLTLLGLSNVSFGLKPAARAVLNSVFLHECREAGLDSAILHASKIMPLYKIDDRQREVCLDLIYDRRRPDYDPLTELVKLFETVTTQAAEARPDLPLEEDLPRRIVEGDRNGLEAQLDLALAHYEPLTIINDYLLAGMKTVGELFGTGQMQLPFVLQSAEVMKSAVAYLEPHMPKSESGRSRGTMVLATVKSDVHDIGKNLVDIILTNNGYRVVNLGIKQPLNAIVDAALQEGADVIGLSGLLVKSTLVMRDNLDEMNRRGLSYFPVVLGGAALTRAYVEQDLRALYDGEVFYGEDAFEGLDTMEKLCSPEARLARRERVRRLSGHAEPEVAAEPVKCDCGVVHGTVPQVVSEPTVALDVPVPAAPFVGSQVWEDFDLAELATYVNPLALYGGQFRVRRRSDETRGQWWSRVQREVLPAVEALRERIAAEAIFQPKAVVGFYPAAAEGNDLIVYQPESGDEWVRFSFPRQTGGRGLCLADFFRRAGGLELDVLGVTIVTLGDRCREYEQALMADNKYTDYLYFHGLAVETTEALAEFTHRRLRQLWGIAGDDATDPDGLFRQQYRGARYSFGYPACPNLEDQVQLFELLRPERIGISLSEEFMLVPEVATSAIVVHHPEARYFAVSEG